MAKKPVAQPQVKKRWWRNTQNSEAQSKADKAKHAEMLKSGVRPSITFVSSLIKKGQ